MIEHYVKLPVEVRAVRFDGTLACGYEIVGWLEQVPGVRVFVVSEGANGIDVVGAVRDAEKIHGARVTPPAVVIEAQGNTWLAERGDWVIRDEYDSISTAEQDVFEEDYAAYETSFADERCDADIKVRQPMDVHAVPMGADEVRIVTNVADHEIVVTCPRCGGTITRLTEIDERISYRPEVEAAIARHLAEQSAMYALAHNVRQRDGEQQPIAEAAGVHDLLIADIAQRRDEQYGEYTNDALADAYEDALSVVINLRLALSQRFNPNP